MYAALLNKKLVMAVNEAQLVHQQYKKLNDDNYRCPVCQKRVILVISQLKSPFFKHISFITGVGEKEEHLQSKQLLCSALVACGYPAKMEVILAENQLRADILASDNLAFEIQCAPLSEAEYFHRHFLYNNLKIKDIWIVGKRHYLINKLHKSQRKYLRKSKIWDWYLLEVDPEAMMLYLKYQIQLAPNNDNCYYQKKGFTIDERGLNKLFNFIPKKKNIKYNSSQIQLNYLRKQLREKTNFGRQLGEYLYRLGLTIDDLPNDVLTKNRDPFEEKRVINFCKKKTIS